MYIGLVKEIRFYAGLEIGTLVDTIPLKVINQHIIPYSKYIETLLEPFQPIPQGLRKYINVEKMVYYQYQQEKILIFRFDPQNDREEFFDEEDELEEPEDTCGFINGVKLLDDFDIREQITANEFTGGYWEPELHWVLDIQKIRQLAKEATKAAKVQQEKPQEEQNA
jgi:hypothetical protein